VCRLHSLTSGSSPMKYRMGHFVFSITRRGVHPCVEAVAPKAIGVDPGEPGGDTDS
jgi:hypothetical protein